MSDDFLRRPLAGRRTAAGGRILDLEKSWDGLVDGQHQMIDPVGIHIGRILTRDTDSVQHRFLHGYDEDGHIGGPETPHFDLPDARFNSLEVSCLPSIRRLFWLD